MAGVVTDLRGNGCLCARGCSLGGGGLGLPLRIPCLFSFGLVLFSLIGVTPFPMEVSRFL